MSENFCYEPTPFDLDLWFLHRVSRTTHGHEWECAQAFLESRYTHIKGRPDYGKLVENSQVSILNFDTNVLAMYKDHFHKTEMDFLCWKEDSHNDLLLRGLVLEECDKIYQLRIAAGKSWPEIAAFITATQGFNCSPADAALAFGYVAPERIGYWEAWKKDWLEMNATYEEWRRVITTDREDQRGLQ